jgi:hypothetical protein
MDDVPIVIDPPGADFMHVPDFSAEAMIRVSRDPPS